MKFFVSLSAVVLVSLLSACQAAKSPTGGPGFQENPTDGGSRYSFYNLPSSRMGEQNVDLED
jgi:hypothetical protein